MPQYSKKNHSPCIGKNGKELLTPNWKSKVNDTNKYLIGIVKDKIMCLPVGTFYYLDSEFLYCSYCVIITGSHIDTLMSLLIRYAHIPFYFCFSFAFSTLSIHHYAPPLRRDCMRSLAWQSHSLHQTNLAYLMDTWLMIHMYLLLFLVSPMFPLLQSDQSQALTPRSQELSITLPYAHFLVYHSY